MLILAKARPSGLLMRVYLAMCGLLFLYVMCEEQSILIGATADGRGNSKKSGLSDADNALIDGNFLTSFVTYKGNVSKPGNFNEMLIELKKERSIKTVFLVQDYNDGLDKD